jgi:hypothetical protein
MLIYLFWPVIAAFIPGGLFATRRPLFASISVVVLLGLATYQSMTNALVVNRAGAVAVSWSEVGIGVCLGWVVVRRLGNLPGA